MKKVIFAALAAALAVTACNRNQTSENESANVEKQTVSAGDIAYVNTEYVLTECELFKTEGLALREKTEKAQQSWANKERNLQNEAAQLQEKYQKGLITTRDAQAQQEALEKKAANYQTNTQKEAQTLDEENYVFTNRLQDLLLRAVQELNSDKQYKLVVNASALLDADNSLDISETVLEKMNELYTQEKKNK
ncbi:MAG: OmpH family outer membrane protein [Alistipes sp.]|nr:OmpH family outer membrane protein [Alistipes sp.]